MRRLWPPRLKPWARRRVRTARSRIRRQPSGTAVVRALTGADVLILSGGVSAGDFDFVPDVLRQLGVQLHFEKVAVQPGMPTVFGTKKQKAFFGLPGNPVSTFVIFEVFIKPFLYRRMGYAFRPLSAAGTFKTGFRRKRAERTLFLPVRFQAGEVEAVIYHGSGHLQALSRANALLTVPSGTEEILAGSRVDVRLL